MIRRLFQAPPFVPFFLRTIGSSHRNTEKDGGLWGGAGGRPTSALWRRAAFASSAMASLAARVPSMTETLASASAASSISAPRSRPSPKGETPARRGVAFCADSVAIARSLSSSADANFSLEAAHDPQPPPVAGRLLETQSWMALSRTSVSPRAFRSASRSCNVGSQEVSAA